MKPASLTFASLLSLASLTGPSSLPAGVECKCRRASEKESTRPGGNEMVIFVEEKNYRELRGTVQLRDGQPVENALVEIFDKPEYLLDGSPQFAIVLFLHEYDHFVSARSRGFFFGRTAALAFNPSGEGGRTR